MTKIINLSPSEIQLLKEELDIDDEMDEADEKQSDDDPYFLLAQRLANAPQVKVRMSQQVLDDKLLLTISKLSKITVLKFVKKKKNFVKLNSLARMYTNFHDFCRPFWPGWTGFTLGKIGHVMMVEI